MTMLVKYAVERDEMVGYSRDKLRAFPNSGVPVLAQTKYISGSGSLSNQLLLGLGRYYRQVL